MSAPPQFTAAMAKWLSDVCAIKIVEAADDMVLTPGVAYVGPGGMQFRVADELRALEPCRQRGGKPGDQRGSGGAGDRGAPAPRRKGRGIVVRLSP